jgi:hypothetical protein
VAIFSWESGDVLSFDKKLLGNLKDISLEITSITKVLGRAKEFDLQENACSTGEIYLRYKDSTAFLPNCVWAVIYGEFQFHAFPDTDNIYVHYTKGKQF